MQKYILLLFLSYFYQSEGNAQSTSTSKGLFAFNFTEPDSDVLHENLVWFDDDVFIFEMKLFVTLQLDSGTYEGYDVFRYAYYDLKTKRVYEFRDFSDSSKIVSTYFFDRTTSIIPKIFEGKSVTGCDNVVKLTDTLIHNETFSRLMYTENRPEKEYTREDIYYFDCDGYKTEKISINKLYEKFFPDCTIRMIDVISSIKSSVIRGRSTFQILRPTLTKAEEDIFRSWETKVAVCKLPVITATEAQAIAPVPIKFRDLPIYKALYRAY